ncbi:acetyl-CoA carboxylase biotin carboxyl carrier protein subunit [Acetobacter sp. TBRC 12305]|uniref:Acetyl-CoA carboxylase biotin carboxyl carrier protein subunit n=1 Tax=Acetobacter garciniae TaxID=2817435 RepID=A0A939HJV9_9PROT|nr:acetyl-CoA carboxylase biotin carboxyl carrier protein subunit [Acetobacter garciniae]MBO1325775.1 acetyl-CoA carboxylase biotin carboxyl carrier protein subunit [Acetobacter garciniae]MBX0345675.1 acetyl-CoA carboxylase biotin carboxyl carrier protein subunit [Acetobacter garciniae]
MGSNHAVTDRVARLRDIVARMRQGGMALLDYDDGQTRLLLRLAPEPGAQNAVSAPLPPPAQPASAAVPSPDLGVFHATHPPASGKGMAVGDKVSAGQIMAFVEVGPIVLPVVAPAGGQIGTINAVEGQSVGYHEVLFEIAPA